MNEEEATGKNDDPNLDLTRDRDAYAAIRGFVYQVNLTVVRWLELGEDEILELERGEDIDRLTRGIENFDGWQRLLEQVKHREGSLTLRTPSVRGALANFLEHRATNPGRTLRFRFTTNADVGTEKSNPMPGGEPGVRGWQGVHSDAVPEGDLSAFLAGLRELLLNAPRPSGVPTTTWDAWQEFLISATEAEFVEFIKQVEITTGTVDATDLQPSIEARLSELGLASGSAAERLYQVLFVSVFKRLSARGPKRLDRDALLAEVEGAGLGAQDQHLTERLSEFRRQLDQRLESVETQVASLESKVVEIQAEVTDLQYGIIESRAPRGVQTGDSKSFQTTDHYFGRSLSPTSTFNHARELLGREGTLSDAVEEAEAVVTHGSGVVVLCGRGGVGKSRLLLEVARELEDRGELQVRWVRDTETPDTASLNELPDGAVAIFCDDAHRRADLHKVLAVAETRADPTAVVIGLRPHGGDALRVASYEAGIGPDRITKLEDLEDLEQEDLLELVRAELGPDDDHLAEAVVNLTGGSTLVATVAARLLHTRRLDPRILSQDPEIRQVVLSGFENEIYGRIGDKTDEVTARRVVELISAVGPFAVGDDDLVAAAASFVGVDSPAFLRTVGALQEAGVLTEQRGGLRITPDVLSDYVLNRTLVAAGRPTHQEIRLLEELGPAVLSHILRNVAELDWQITAANGGAGKQPDIFAQIWERFVKHFEASSHWERMQLLDSLKPVAAFQPARMLDLCERIVVDPTEPADDEDPSFGPADVLGKIPTLLRIVCQHQDHYERALDLLWRLGANDDRELNPFPEHGIRILGDAVKYSRRHGIWRQEGAVSALRQWTRETGWSEHSHSPLVIADAVLQRSMVEDVFDDETSQLTMTRYGVNAEVTADVRRETIQLLEELVLGPEPRGRIWATESLLGALDPPDGQFGHVVTDEEEQGFRTQYESAFDAIQRIAEQTEDPLVRIKLRDGLTWVVRRTGLDWKLERAEELIGVLSEDEETELARVWSQNFRELTESFEETSSRAAEATTRVAARLLENTKSVDELAAQLVAEHDRFESTHTWAQPGYLLAEISKQNPDRAAELISAILAADDGDLLSRLDGGVRVILSQLRRSSRPLYDPHIQVAAVHERPSIRRAAAYALRWIDQTDAWDEMEQTLLADLLQDDDPGVQAAAVDALQATSAEEAARLLPFVDVNGDEQVARAVADLWGYRKPAEWPPLLREEVERLLEGFLALPSLNRNLMHVEEMLAALAKTHPLPVLEFLIERVEREIEESRDPDRNWSRGYRAIPYQGIHSVWASLQSSDEHAAIVRRLLEAIVEERRTVTEPWRRQTVKVSRSIMRWDDEVESVIREWMSDGRTEDIADLAPLIEGQPQRFVLERHEFLGALIATLNKQDGKAADAIQKALLRSTDRPIQVRPVGEPDPRDSELRDEARRVSADLADHNQVAASFYRRVAKDAQERIDADTRRDARRKNDDDLS